MFNKNLQYFPNVDFLLAAVRGDHAKVGMKDYGKGAAGYMAEEGLPAVTISDIMIQNNWDNIDVIKMDIEGSEKSVFEKNYENWLPKTKILFVELHERKVPGCTATMESALEKYNFERSASGEYEVLINKDLI